MNQLKVFDRALLGKQIAGNGFIVIIDVIYLIVGVFFGSMELRSLLSFILISNILATCILYQNFLVTRGEMNLELITQKVLYYPTTRYQYLWNKYAKTLFFLLIQLILTMLCFVLGYYGNRGQIDLSRVMIGMLTVYISILLTSGVAILLVHTMPLGIYLSTLIFYPLSLFLDRIQEVIGEMELMGNGIIILGIIMLITAFLWGGLLYIGGKVYERVN